MRFFGGYNIYKEPFTRNLVCTRFPCPSAGPSARWRTCCRRCMASTFSGAPRQAAGGAATSATRNLMDEHRKKKLLKNYHPGKLPTDLSRAVL